MEEVYVGIDVSKQWLDVGMWPDSQSVRVGNDGAGIARLVEQLRTLNPRAIVLESSGGLEVLAASELHAAGLMVAVVNPRQVREFARSLGTLGKTDGPGAVRPLQPQQWAAGPDALGGRGGG